MPWTQIQKYCEGSSFGDEQPTFANTIVWNQDRQRNN
jgi:hypothetical protein